MHMSDALVSPAVGAVGWAAAIGLTVYAGRQLRNTQESGRPALMGVLGAFVFAAQMINFSIPGTGSSGHLGGGLLLSALLGSHAGFLVMASVLTVQALLFADGGLLALGCNIVNLGLFTCFVACPLLFRPLAGSTPTRRRLGVAAVVAAVVGLLLGASGVVVQTVLSGISQLPFGTFVAFMLPIHVGIGLVEGLVTAGVLLYVWRARPELVRLATPANPAARSLRPLLITFAGAAVVLGGAISWFASTRPDGLEWSMGKVSGIEELAAPGDGLYGRLARLQEKTALMPDYSFGSTPEGPEGSEAAPTWPAPDAATSVSGLVGAGVTLLLALAVGFGARLLRARTKDCATKAS